MPLAVRWYRWLDGRWAVPWLTLPTMPSASRSAKVRWTVVCGSPRMSAISRRIDEGRPAEGVEQLSFGNCHSTSVSIERPTVMWQCP